MIGIKALSPPSIVAVAALFLATVANALPVALDFDVTGVGYITPASKLNNDADVVIGVNALIDLYNPPHVVPDIEDVTLALDVGTGLPSVLPSPAAFGEKDEVGPDFDAVDNTVYSYLLGKYGNVAFLFYIGDLAPGMYTLPLDLGLPGAGLNGLSHQVALTAPRTDVPDSSATLSLLGMALIAFAFIRRSLIRA